MTVSRIPDPAAERERLYQLLGRLPERNRPAAVLDRRTDTSKGYVRETLLLDLNGIEPVPAYVLKPLEASYPLPLVLYHHSHGGRYTVGKDELFAGAPYLLEPAYGETLVQEGYAVLCIDAWAFGQRSGRTESELFKHMLWHGQVLWGMMVYDALRALDYALSRSDVDPSRVGTLGMSMGSTMAWWLAALDPRIRVTVDLCCMTDSQALIEDRGLDRHGLYYYVPDLLRHFTTGAINSLIAPRVHVSLNGRLDPLTPVDGLKRIDAEVGAAYAAAGRPEAWKLGIYETAHQETPAMRKEVLRTFRTHL